MAAKAISFSLEQSANYFIYSIQAASFTNLNRALRPHGLTTPAWRVLANLQERDGISLGELAGQTTIDISNLSKLIESMRRKGLVSKRRSKEDARVTEIYLTRSGRDKFGDALPSVRLVLEDGLAGFSADERRAFMDYLRRMKRNVTVRT